MDRKMSATEFCQMLYKYNMISEKAYHKRIDERMWRQNGRLSADDLEDESSKILKELGYGSFRPNTDKPLY